MKKIKASIFLAGALSLGLAWEATASEVSLQPTNTLNSESTSTVQVAQGFEGQCRLTNRTADIFSQPSVGNASQRIRILTSDTRVTLGSVVSNGWISVTAPVEGYIIARYLKGCPGGNTAANPQPTPTPTPTTGSGCRTTNVGLIIRPRPIAGSLPLVGSVAAGSNITITGAAEQDSVGRTWYRISAPQAGWVSGGVGNNSNLVNCSN
ncbi:MAG: hypothetical protein WA865_13340 [Spirulinaceae cyanobacterium]